MPHSSSRSTFSYAARASAGLPSAACRVAAATSSSESSSSASCHGKESGGYWRVLHGTESGGYWPVLASAGGWWGLGGAEGVLRAGARWVQGTLWPEYHRIGHLLPPISPL